MRINGIEPSANGVAHKRFEMARKLGCIPACSSIAGIVQKLLLKEFHRTPKYQPFLSQAAKRPVIQLLLDSILKIEPWPAKS
jgi:hypothetical protein